MIENRLKEYEELFDCSICHTPMVVPFYYACNQHATCHACANQWVQQRKVAAVDPVNGPYHIYDARCPECNFPDSIDDSMMPVINRTLPNRFVTIQSRKMITIPDPNNRLQCPYCQLTPVTQTHVERCGVRPVACKHCGAQDINFNQFHHHLAVCASFNCGYIGCSDGKRLTWIQLQQHRQCHTEINSLLNSIKALHTLPQSNALQRMHSLSLLRSIIAHTTNESTPWSLHLPLHSLHNNI